MVPGADPLTTLARVTCPPRADTADWTRRCAEGFRGDPSYLTRMVGAFGNQPVVLVVDQFEEVFTLCDDDQARQMFIANLLTLIHAAGARHTVILTMRSDFEEKVQLTPALHQLFEQCQVRVTPLTAAELRDAIERPAALVGLKFEEGVVDVLIRDILGEPAALPLLQFTLLKLW